MTIVLLLQKRANELSDHKPLWLDKSSTDSSLCTGTDDEG